MSTPVENFISRTLDPDVEKLLSLYSGLLDEIVNFGSNIMTWKPIDYNKDDSALVPSLFLRNYLSYVDACSILIKHSSIEPCNGLLRTSFESLLYILYLLEDQTGQKAQGYIIWNAFEKRKLIEKCDGISDSYKKLDSAFRKNEILKDEKPVILDKIETIREKNNNLIQSQQYSQIVAEYHRTKRKCRKDNERFNWYTLFNGPKSLYQLSEMLNLEAFYEVLYRTWSASIHGTSVIDGIVTADENNTAQINQIRMPFNSETVTGISVNLSYMLFSKYVKTKHPDNIGLFKDWYATEKKKTQILNTRITRKLKYSS